MMPLKDTTNRFDCLDYHVKSALKAQKRILLLQRLQLDFLNNLRLTYTKSFSA